MNVVFCSSEVTPFAKTGGLADVCGALPLALHDEAVSVAIIMPFYGCIDAKGFDIKKLNDEIFFTKIKDVDVYFIKSPQYFDRNGLYGSSRGDYEDNLERFSYFCKRILRFLKEINLRPDIIHCHDWQTALIPLYLRTLHKDDPFFQRTRTMFTIHNMAYQGIFPRGKFALLNLPGELNSPAGLEFYNQINLLKGGILFSDVVTTVSYQYAQEIRQKEFSYGLEGVVRQRADAIRGILNGIDIDYWNPKKDPLIKEPFSWDKLAGKAVNKKALQECCGFNVDPNIPLFGFVGRLSFQKGLDLVLQALPEILVEEVQFVFQGVGDEGYQRLLIDTAEKYRGKVGAHIVFDEGLAHQVYAGADFFLIPSRYEPCGLSQMISFRYGTVPVVHHTGGLVDTVEPFDEKAPHGDGFVFAKFEKEALVRAIKKAAGVFRNDRAALEELMVHVMKYDFSWVTSAKEYKKVYRQCLS